MATISLDKQIRTYSSQLGIAKDALLGKMKSFLSHKDDKPRRLTIEEYNKEIDEAEQEINAGQFTSQEDAKKQVAAWFTR